MQQNASNSELNTTHRIWRLLVLPMLLTACVVVFLNSTTLAKDSEKPFSSISIIDSVFAVDSSLQGKVVYVDFWASWCAPCRASFPWMNRLAKKYKAKGLQIVTINLDRKHDNALKFLEELDNDLGVVFDSTGNLAKLFEIDAMPTSFLYDRKGSLRDRHQGFSPKDTTDIVNAIRDLLDEDAKE